MINSIVGTQTSLKGEFELDGVLRIDGTFHGKIEGNSQILVGETGAAYCDITAQQIVIGGYIEGNLFIKGKVTVLNTGHFKGKLNAYSIEIIPGATLEAKCSMIPKPKELEEEESAHD